MKQIEVKNLKELLAPYIGSFEIVKQTSTMLTAPGEHYGSIMLALDLLIRKDNLEEELKLVAKFLPASEMLRAAFDTAVTFKKEVIAYTKIIPAFVQLQKEQGVPSDELINIFPKCYGARLNLDKNQNAVDDDAVLIFENLKVQGYDTYNRYLGIDLDASKVVLRDLAKFHAIGIAMKLLKPDDFQEVVGPCLVRNKGMDFVTPEIDASFKYSVVTVASTIPEIAQYVERIDRAFEESKKNFKSDKQPRPQWGTLNHGDYWVNNTMIKKDINNKPIQNKIIDLQILEYDSAVHDLIFFLFTSVDNEILSQHYEELLKTYHNSFLKTINQFNVDTDHYTWEEFLKEIEIEAPKEFFHVTFMLKFIFAEKLQIKSLEEFQPSDWSRNDLLAGNHSRKLKVTVLEYIKRNWI